MVSDRTSKFIVYLDISEKSGIFIDKNAKV